MAFWSDDQNILVQTDNFVTTQSIFHYADRMENNPLFLPLKEAGFFLAINVGASLLLQLGQLIWPELFFTAPAFLITIGTMLLCNIYRAFVSNHARFVYILIILLNILTTGLIGNSGFLTSIRTIYLLISSLI